MCCYLWRKTVVLPCGRECNVRMQVLVATMHQTDTSLAEKMNIRCDAVLANQADRTEITVEKTPHGQRKMITTDTRGVGLNRNIALLASDADILLLADDDVTYNDDMPAAVEAAFEALPQADVIVFSMDILKNGEVTPRREKAVRRLRVHNAMRYGTYRIAVRRRALLNHNITFHQSFGGGCPFSAGEDSLFLKSCFDSGLRVYVHPYTLGTCCKDTSTWFRGCDDKYFYDKGVLMRKLFPRTAYLMALYFGVRFKLPTEKGVFTRLRWIYKGVRGGRRMIPFADYRAGGRS